MTKRFYVMSPAEHAMLTEASTPPALVVVRHGGAMAWNAHERAEAFWRALGEVRGFDWRSAEPCVGMHAAYFRAQPTGAA